MYSVVPLDHLSVGNTKHNNSKELLLELWHQFVSESTEDWANDAAVASDLRILVGHVIERMLNMTGVMGSQTPDDVGEVKEDVHEEANTDGGLRSIDERVEDVLSKVGVSDKVSGGWDSKWKGHMFGVNVNGTVSAHICLYFD